MSPDAAARTAAEQLRSEYNRCTATRGMIGGKLTYTDGGPAERYPAPATHAGAERVPGVFSLVVYRDFPLARGEALRCILLARQGLPHDGAADADDTPETAGAQPPGPDDLAGQIMRIAQAIAGHRYRFDNEIRLHDGIEAVLATSGIPARREAQLTAADRIDFLAGRVGIEVKIAGKPGDVVRQLRRYAASPDVDALVLVTTRARHRGIPRVIGGKPVRVVWLSGVTG